MRFEHTLSPIVQKSIHGAIEQLNTQRAEYLRALGIAKELETQLQALQQAVSQQLAMVQLIDGLPVPIQPYQLSADGTKLIGEVPDPAPAPAAVLPIVAAPEGGQAFVNGADLV